MARDIRTATLIVLLGSLALIGVVPAITVAQPSETPTTTNQTTAVDYQIDSISKLDYYNSRGFEDQNGDGKIVLKLTKMLNLSQSRDPTLTYGGHQPLVIEGPGGFTEVPAPLISGVPDDSNLILKSISIRNVSADDHDDNVISVASSVSLTNVTIRNTVHEARYPADTFSETHRVSVVNAGGTVTATDTEIANAGQAISTSGPVKIRSSHIHHIVSRGSGAVQSGSRIELQDTVISASIGRYAGALHSNGVLLRNATLRDVDTGSSGGGIDTENGARIINSTIENASARDNGGAIASKGNVVVRNSTIVDAHSEQGSSLYAYGARLTLTDVTLKNADTVSFGKGGVTSGSIAVQDSRLIETNKLHAATIDIQHTTVNKSLSLYGQDFTIRRSTLKHTGSIDGYTVTVTDSMLRDLPRVQGSQEIRIRDSLLLSSAGFQGSQLLLTNVTLYEPGRNVIPETKSRSLRQLNVIEAEAPVFEGTLPDRERVFVDTNNDSEPPGEWDADVFWSRDQPFPSATNLPVVANKSTATPTLTSTPTPTKETVTATITETSSPEPPTTVADTAEPGPDAGSQNDGQFGMSGGELPSFSVFVIIAVGCVVLGIILVLLGVATD